MISASSIQLSQANAQSITRINHQNAQVQAHSQGSSAQDPTRSGEDREIVVSRDARYQYQNSEQRQYVSTSTVQGPNGDRSLSASAELAQTASNVMLEGQEALRVGVSAMNASADQGMSTNGSVRMQANRFTFVSETQNRQVAATGSIELDDGRNVDFTIGINQRQSRQYAFSESVRVEERAMTDPLVINFDSPSATLGDTVFEFDLNGNGDPSEYATLSAGSGYLALDRNDNGKVDDGGELFGPASGSGFKELASLDKDGNKWLDRNDPAFDRLQVMVQGRDGEQQLRTLSEVGVEALYTGSTQDRFSLTSSQGVPLGEIRATGLYLSEDGEVRTLEELDLARQEKSDTPEQETVLTEGMPTQSDVGNNTAPRMAVGDSVQERVQNIREALDKLDAIHSQQQAFIDQSQSPEDASKTDLDRFMEQMDQLRVRLLEDTMKRREAANEYARGLTLNTE